MGFFSAIALLPLAPVRGVAWVAQQVAEEAERQGHGEERLRRELLQAELDRDAGLIDADEHEQRVALLAEQLAEARRRPPPALPPAADEEGPHDG
jgi:SOS response regulatory protein OraA/RecX